MNYERRTCIHDFKMTEIKSISVSQEFSKLAKENNISWSEAARIGMSILLSERGLVEYDNRLNLVRKMNQFKDLAEQASQKLSELTEQSKQNSEL